MPTPILDTQRPPDASIAWINFRFPNGRTGSGTGILLTPRHVLTSAHLVYNRERGGYANALVAYPARNGDASPFGAFSGRVPAHVPKPYVDSKDPAHDFAVITLKTPATQVPLGFTLAALPDARLQDQQVRITGYPGHATQGTLWQDSDRIRNVDPQMVYFKAELGAGASGAPVYFHDPAQGKTFLVGINKGSNEVASAAVRINATVGEHIRSWLGAETELFA